MNRRQNPYSQEVEPSDFGDMRWIGKGLCSRTAIGRPGAPTKSCRRGAKNSAIARRGVGARGTLSPCFRRDGERKDGVKRSETDVGCRVPTG
jgi:hypothetical protein